jgi:hypothetical protein
MRVRVRPDVVRGGALDGVVVTGVEMDGSYQSGVDADWPEPLALAKQRG